MRHGTKIGCATAAVALTAVAATPALGGVGPQGVRAGNNITVFHNIDMVVAAGHANGQATQVDVFRGSHRIATARGRAVDAGEGGTLEVNHGPVGAPQPGDCFEGGTPDVRPGDRIVVSNPGAAGVDEAIVDNITIASRTTVTRDAVTGGPPRFTAAIPDDPATPLVDESVAPQPLPTRQEVWVQGVARLMNANGTPGATIPIAQLDSAEFLGVPDDNQLRMRPNQVVAGPTAGSYIAKYFDANPGVNGSGFVVDRNRSGHSDASIFTRLATGEGFSMGYGHVDPLPPVSMLVDGLTEQTTPAPGCESAPRSAASAGTTSADTLNIANAGPAAADPVLTVGGWAAAGTGAATVELSDGTGAPVSRAVTGLSAASTGQQGWTATFTKADLAGLDQTVLSARLRVGAALVGAAKSVRYDTVAPAFGVSHASGTYTGTQRVAVTNASDQVTYRLNGGPATPYTGTTIVLENGTHQLVFRSVDAAGNATQTTRTYTVVAPPPPAPQQQQSQQQATTAAATALTAPVQVVAGSRSAARPVATMLAGRKTLRLRSARRQGLVARFSAPAAGTAVIRVLRGRTVLATRTVRVRAGRSSVKLRSRALRRRLRAGRLTIAVELRGADGATGPAATSSLRLTR